MLHIWMIVEDHQGERVLEKPLRDVHGAALKGCDQCTDFCSQREIRQGRSCMSGEGTLPPATRFPRRMGN